MRALCVYCGSRSGLTPDYTDAARQFGLAMAKRGIGLVYGGGTPGLMGVIADTVLAAGGEVTGVITRFLRDKELGHAGLTRQYVTESMHERKALMAHLSDGFVALPGGLGTLEEIIEMISWAQLDLHTKPCGLLNVGGFYDGLARFFDHATAEGFVHTGHRAMILLESQPDDLLDAVERYTAPAVSKFPLPAR